ncbi:MAG: hypothetical protein AAGH82_04105 [Pseudomonadota bacterium]
MGDQEKRAHLRPMVGVFTIVCLSMVGLAAPSIAGEELLVRKTVKFAECKHRTLAAPVALKARPDRVSIVLDTGAEFKLKIAARKANLVIGCNKVSDQMEVYRTTPGDAPASPEPKLTAG